jgi:cytochrome c-type biogenesis protein CcmH/NrfG
VDEVWQGIGDWETNYRCARALLTAAVRADPDNPKLLTCLGTVLSDMGSHRQAIAMLAKAVKLGATDRHTFFNLAVATLNTGAHARAMRLFEKAGKLKPRAGTWEAYFDPQAH